MGVRRDFYRNSRLGVTAMMLGVAAAAAGISVSNSHGSDRPHNAPAAVIPSAPRVLTRDERRDRKRKKPFRYARKRGYPERPRFLRDPMAFKAFCKRVRATQGDKIALVHMHAAARRRAIAEGRTDFRHNYKVLSKGGHFPVREKDF